MPILLHSLLFTCYLAAATVAGLMAPALVAHLQPMGISIAGGVLAFLACLVGHLMALRLTDSDAADNAVARARGAARNAERQAVDLRARLLAIQTGLDSSARRETADLAASIEALRADLASFSLQAVVVPSPPAPVPAPVAAPTPVFSPRTAASFASVAPTPPAPLSDEQLLFEAVRAAIADNRVDLHAREIVDLPDHQIRLVEVIGQVRDAAGDVLLAEDYLPAAEQAGRAGPLDNLLLLRSLQLLRQLRRTSALPPALVRLSAHSLQDGDFFPQFVDFLQHNTDLTEAVVFALAEPAFEALAKSSDPGLARLAGIGFTFSIDGITRLDHDARTLGALNVRYLRLAASDLFDDAEAAGALSSRLEAAGVALIVDDVEDDETEAVLLETGIRLGGGPLYGSHRTALELAL